MAKSAVDLTWDELNAAGREAGFAAIDARDAYRDGTDRPAAGPLKAGDQLNMVGLEHADRG